ncbi:AAA family ATPase [Candidatus Marithioploca araucensis]|uniref:AAA family ATPase n=1 Tax=Candidatus Marithioploca araucensis TaxID=70273 RepID=A0ABT7VR35_9GAMM|nr:AAA family ATPase [Candidatus Marithioploca araucensis]
MKIHKLRLKNFRGFEEKIINFHPHFNVIIGVNGTGKTATLEGLCVAIGSFFLGIDYAENRHIQNDDIRIVNYEDDMQEQFPVQVDCWGTVLDQNLNWQRELTGHHNKTTFIKAKNIKELSKNIQEKIRGGKDIELPIIVYYATERLWKERLDSGKTILPSRFRGYYNGLRPTSCLKFFLKWFKEKEMAAIQHGKDYMALKVVRKAVSCCVADCVNIYYELNPDKEQTLMMELKGGKILPFRLLSDGARNMLAMVADIAFRCTLLNPKLGEEAAIKTSGVVLIDELDLHLHPSWQKQTVYNLKRTFPQIQFITTTHSPFVIQELDEGELIRLDSEAVGEYVDQSIEDIAENVQGVENPQWSRKRQQMYETAKQYYQTLQKMNGDISHEEVRRLRAKLDELSTPFADNLAYHAFLEQERLFKEAELGILSDSLL